MGDWSDSCGIDDLGWVSGLKGRGSNVPVIVEVSKH